MSFPINGQQGNDNPPREPSTDEWLANILAEPRRHDPERWGGWVLNRENYTLELYQPERRQGWIYYVDLERCLTSAQTLDWICQVAGKAWADTAVIAGLVHALDDVLDPQANLCSFGRGKQLDRQTVGRLVDAYPHEAWQRAL